MNTSTLTRHQNSHESDPNAPKTTDRARTTSPPHLKIEDGSFADSTDCYPQARNTVDSFRTPAFFFHQLSEAFYKYVFIHVYSTIFSPLLFIEHLKGGVAHRRLVSDNHRKPRGPNVRGSASAKGYGLFQQDTYVFQRERS